MGQSRLLTIQEMVWEVEMALLRINAHRRRILMLKERASHLIVTKILDNLLRVTRLKLAEITILGHRLASLMAGHLVLIVLVQLTNKQQTVNQDQDQDKTGKLLVHR
jgi:hypothetical protein